MEFNLTNLARKEIQEQIVVSSFVDGMKHDLSPFSSRSSFENDIWYLDLYFRNVNYVNHVRKFDFTPIKNKQLKYALKSFTYNRILNGVYLYSASGDLRILKKMIRESNSLCVEDIEKNLEKIYQTLVSSSISQNQKFYIWQTLKRFLQYIKSPYLRKMDMYYMEYDTARSYVERYIPDEVADQFDNVMKNDADIPLHYRTIYWTLRMYPNRITEVLSTKIDCIKHYEGTKYTLTFHVYKTAGSQEGTPKILLIDTAEPLQAFYLDLLLQQQAVARAVFKQYPEMGNYLFLGNRSRYKKSLGRYIHDKTPLLVKASDFNRFLKLIAERKQIMQGDVPAKISSHQFRHNATTDRVESGLFRPIDLRPMTLHANDKMFNESYHYKTCEQVVKQSHDIMEKMTNETVLFRGKIVNSADDRAFDYFLKRPFAFSLNGMGICVDSRECSKDKFACLACQYFIPNCDDLLYFQEQLKEWQHKLVVAEKIGNEYYCENVKYNISLFQRVIEKIENHVKKSTGEGNNE